MPTRRRHGTRANKAWGILSPIAEKGAQCHNFRERSQGEGKNGVLLDGFKGELMVTVH